MLMAPVLAVPAPAMAGGLCRAGEEMLFACDIGAKKVAVCGGKERGGARYAQYRFGTSARIELAYPARGTEGLTYASEMYSGGGQVEINFTRDGLSYGVFSRTIRTGFGPDGRNNPKFDAGVFVKRGDRLLSDRKCTNPDDASVNLQLAEKYLKPGPFTEHFAD